MDNIVKKLSQSDSLLDIMIQMEDFLDNMDLYAFDNWIDGEIVEGPDISRYWVSFSLLYPEDKMPDPNGAIRLINVGIKVDFKQVEVQDNKLPTKKGERISIDSIMTASNTDSAIGTSLGNVTPPVKMKYKSEWLVTITIPRHFIDDMNNINLYSFDDDVQNAIDKEYHKPSSNLMNDKVQESLTEGLNSGDLKDLCLDTISIDFFKSKINDNCIVVAFYILYRNPAIDLNSFIQKTAADILDSDVSPAPTEDGYYVVFLELERNDKFIERLLYILDTLKSLTNIDSWNFRSYGKEDVFPANEDTLKDNVRLSKSIKEKIEDFFISINLVKPTIKSNKIIHENETYDFVAFGNKDKISKKYDKKKYIVFENDKDILLIKKEL